MKDYDALYGPKTIDDIIFQSEEIRMTIEKLATGKFPFPSAGRNGILLWGKVGTGKSSLARILPNAIAKSHGQIHANASMFSVSVGGDNGAMLLEKMKKQSEHIPFSDYHYFVLDEIDNLRPEAMSALRSVMEVPRTTFIMTTNNLAKLNASVQDRSHIIEMNGAAETAWLPVVKNILTKEGKADVYADDDLLDIIRPCNGSARGIINATYQLL